MNFSCVVNLWFGVYPQGSFSYFPNAYCIRYLRAPLLPRDQALCDRCKLQCMHTRPRSVAWLLVFH